VITEKIMAEVIEEIKENQRSKKADTPELNIAPISWK